jgi:sigma-E factor negative regulatory protein RseC
MDASVCIGQEGTVEEINDHLVKVRIQRDSACGHCSVSGICNSSDGSGRLIETTTDAQDLSIGDMVDITLKRSMGNKAVVLGYLIPFMLLLVVLILLNSLGFEEWISGLLSLSALIPYYCILFLFRDRLKRTFSFIVRKKEL